MLLTNEYVNQSQRAVLSSLHPNLLRVNRQIYREAVDILHGENIWIIAHVPAQLLPMIHIPRRFKKDPSYIKYPALHINLASPGATEAMTLIMGDQGIEDFLRFLWEMSWDPKTRTEFKMSSLNLSLCDTPFHTKPKLQSKCLIPFGSVYGLRDLTIQGQVEPGCIEEILHHASSDYKDVARVQRVSQAFIDRAEEAYTAEEFFRAFDLYVHSHNFVRHVVSQIHQDATQPVLHADFVEILEKDDLTWRLIAKADLAINRYEEVKKIGYASFNAFRPPRPPLPPVHTRVNLRLWIARAHRALGERHDELRMFEEAFNAISNKSTFLAALAELFPKTTTEQAKLLAEQQAKQQRGEIIDLEVVRAFWETV